MPPRKREVCGKMVLYEQEMEYLSSVLPGVYVPGGANGAKLQLTASLPAKGNPNGNVALRFGTARSERDLLSGRRS